MKIINYKVLSKMYMLRSIPLVPSLEWSSLKAQFVSGITGGVGDLEVGVTFADGG
jgi:hypothetical protein